MTDRYTDPITEARKLRKQIRKLQKQLAIAKDCIEFYAKPNHYKPDYWAYTHGCEHDRTPDIVYEKGEQAKSTLHKIKNLED